MGKKMAYNGTMTYIDAHCHLLKESELSDAQLVGVKKILVNSAHLDDWGKVTSLKSVISSIGIHPWYVKEACENWAERMEKMLAENSELQVGEIGLDKLKPDFSKQKQIFLTQLKLAQKYNRVASIHCVRAWGEMMPLLRDFKKDTRMLFHGFSGDKIVLGFLTDSNSYFSVHKGTKIPLIPADFGARFSAETHCFAEGVPSKRRPSANTPHTVRRLTIIF